MDDQSRRGFIKKSALLAIAGASFKIAGANPLPDNPFGLETYTLPPLPYASDALEPFIDKATMEIHHGKHHQGYVNNLNKALLEVKTHATSLESLVENASKYGSAVRNNAGGHFNHSMFWKMMSPKGGGEPKGAVADAINSSFGSFSNLKEKFGAAASGRFGSGWAWVVMKDNKLEIGSTPNQDNPLMDVSDFKGTPILALDVWEHAYYLKYQNKRGDYVNAFWNVVNWEEVNRLVKEE